MFRMTTLAQAVRLDTAVHLIQVALTPVFLLSGVAALLSLFATRLGRVADHIDQLLGEARTCEPERKEAIGLDVIELHRRSHLLDTAVVLGALAATATCGAIIMLFFGNLLKADAAAGLLIILFGLAIFLTAGAIVAFGSEMLMSSRSSRLRTHMHWPSIRGRHPRRRHHLPPT